MVGLKRELPRRGNDRRVITRAREVSFFHYYLWEPLKIPKRLEIRQYSCGVLTIFCHKSSVLLHDIELLEIPLLTGRILCYIISLL